MAWWPELRELLDVLEREASAAERRPPRPTDELCAIVDRRSGRFRKPWFR